GVRLVGGPEDAVAHGGGVGGPGLDGHGGGLGGALVVGRAEFDGDVVPARDGLGGPAAAEFAIGVADRQGGGWAVTGQQDRLGAAVAAAVAVDLLGPRRVQLGADARALGSGGVVRLVVADPVGQPLPPVEAHAIEDGLAALQDVGVAAAAGEFGGDREGAAADDRHGGPGLLGHGRRCLVRLGAGVGGLGFDADQHLHRQGLRHAA